MKRKVRVIETHLASDTKLKEIDVIFYDLLDAVESDVAAKLEDAYLESGERAVELAYKLLDNGVKVSTLGPIIHNPQVVERLESYGPKFVENIVQALSRDILCYAMKTLRCCNIVAHVHDEVIVEADLETPVQEVCDAMAQCPSWAEGLLLRADGYECEFYRKD